MGEVWEVSTAIITREARAASGEVQHDRMPALLTPEVDDEWLQQGKARPPPAAPAQGTDPASEDRGIRQARTPSRGGRAHRRGSRGSEDSDASEQS
ncbi:hypothetical protein [Chryseoglobus sp. 28M-23]|uniref:hypothetical protein n=1 Tax=Chryseoglobus sp. 28M-23 TaxID=2772253 RepID=UPI0015CF00CA|nr:hypothetical protein IE160_10630 [Chryseoglobus sp. 28M-23]